MRSEEQTRGIFATLTLLLALLSVVSTAAAFERRSPVVAAVEKAGPAVVNIRTEQIVRRQASPLFGFGDSIFEEFFRGFAPQRTYKTQSIGSGVIIDPRGYILTNSHVIEQASKIYVAVPGHQKEVEATLVGEDERIDLAIIRIAVEGPLPYLPPASSADLMLGETVIAIGNPLGLDHSVTTGIVSSTSRRLPVGGGVVSVFIQTDALINPGNSGGPLLNINGELIGINTAIAQQAQGIGFSVPIDIAKRVLGDLIEHGRIRQAYLGLIPGNIGRALARSRGAGGVLVTEVDAGSPAANAGLQVADVILALDDIAVESPTEFTNLLATYTPDDRIRLSLLRGTDELQSEVRLAAMPEGYGARYAEKVFGFTVGDRDGSVVVDRVLSGSAADRVGIRRGDLVAEMDGERVTGAKQFGELLLKRLGRFPVSFLIVRGNRGYYVDLP
ncbi:peptidase [Desulfuromonas versatilis]|uniref:Peptidase n=1 Tax=Desulfuromonas versatilis TaxID=2802975 RepID=A0ABN6DZX0_9BACT|nr:trypsin-like peptidase domain-containing protein [Desulfuromonas versatilis]BCR05519.1 peptidase [Desulfuromonas versatilis]